MSEFNSKFKEEVAEYLLEGNLAVSFIKKDGSKRLMKCTRNLDTIPIEKHPKNPPSKEIQKSERVFDLEKNEWRSFTWDSVTSITFLSE